MKCSTTACIDKGVLFIAGLLFAVVSLVHFYRFLYTFPVVIGYLVVPHSWSLIGFIIPGLISIWLFVMAFRCYSYSEYCNGVNGDDLETIATKKPRKKL